MNEFELIEAPPLQGEAELDVACSTVAAGGRPVLELNLGQPGENTQPELEDIPGLSPLREVAEGTLAWRDGALYDGENLLLKALSPPQLVQVQLSDLPGLKAREGDHLPEPFTRAIQWDWSLPPEVQLYGLGQRSCGLERRGTSAVNWTTDEPSGHLRGTDPLYQAHPLLWGVTRGRWWAIFFAHTPYSRLDLAQARADRMRWLTLGPSLKLQVHSGRTPQEVLDSLYQTLTPPSAPPLWSLGFHQSRWGYRDAAEIRQLVSDFRNRNLPLDVVHLDIDYMDGYRSFSFDPERFPQPEKLVEDLRSQGVRTVTIIDPGLRFDPGNGYTAVDEALGEDHLIKTVSGSPLVGYCWPDEAVFPDFCQQRTRQWWAEKSRYYLEKGVAGLWIDMNEPAIFDKPFWSGGAKPHPMPLATPAGPPEKSWTHAAFRNIYASGMASATSQAWPAEGEHRPWVLTRSGFTGMGGLAWSWMGDNTSWYEHLALSFPQLASMGLVGSPFVGVDIGGFFGECTGDLYAAWMEASVVYPFMRSHSALGTREQHPWSFGPEVERIARRALNLRYRLLPYIYAASVSQGPGCPPLLRPLFFDYPEVDKFRCLEDQVMFGPSLMAAPFLRRGVEERMVWLPPGGWIDFHSGQEHSGDSTILVQRDPGLTPLFVRAGSVVPTLATEVQSSQQAGDSPWRLYCAPGGEADSVLYRDYGDGFGYAQQAFWRARVRVEDSSLTVQAREGSDELAPDCCLCFPSAQGWSEQAGGFAKL